MRMCMMCSNTSCYIFLEIDVCLIDGFAKYSNIKSHVERHVFGGNEGKHEIIMQPVIFQTYLYDKVWISTRDPNAPPGLDPNYLPDEQGAKIIIKGVHAAQKIIKTTPFRSLGGKMVQNVHPECRDHIFNRVRVLYI